MYCNIGLGKNIKGDSFFKLSSLLKSLNTVLACVTLLGHRSSYCSKVRQDETLCIIFPKFYYFYFLVHKNIMIFVTVACLMTSSPLIMRYRSCFWEDINDDQVSWINLKNFITKCDGIITNLDSLVHLIQIATRIKGPKCLQRIPYKTGLSTTEAMSLPKACTYKAVKIYAVYIA